MRKKLTLIDGYGFVFRAYYAIPPLMRTDGTQLNAVYGFTSMIMKLLENLETSHIALVLDYGGKTFRSEIYPEYKANRASCPLDLIPQFKIIRDSAKAMNLAILEKQGFEADDIIATLTKKYAHEDFQVMIISSDKDLMQLINTNVLMYDAMKNKMITEKNVEEKFFVSPNRVLDVLALIGDQSDNIPGIKGIGPKTAAELINQFGSLENIFMNIGEIKQDKRRQLLVEGEKNARLSKILANLKCDVEINIDLEELKTKTIDKEKLISFLTQEGLNSLVWKANRLAQ
jgi:DNA polymerase-1